jgi:hypothetical protein
MTPEELREKVARAMFARSPLYSGLQWEAVNPLTRDMWLGDADAALAVVREAMREPSREMVIAALDRPASDDLMYYGVWTAMLAASPLREPSP